jgi:hypothetical protein
MAGAMLAAAFGTALGIAFTNAETVVANGFASALETASTSSGATSRSGPLVSGSEAYWLGRHGRVETSGGRIEPTGWSAPPSLSVAAGDRITVASATGQRTLEVVAVTEIPASTTRIETSEMPGRQVLVTCRDTSTANAPLIRFVAFVTPPSAGAKPERAL